MKRANILDRIEKIIVHGGTFHADDVMAAALVRTFAGRMIPVERVPHQQDLSKEIKNPNILVADVGRVYDPSHLNFDHHQFKQPDEEDRAAAGMVFDWLVEEGYINPILEKNLRPLIELIDQNDIGVRKAQVGELPELISGFNRTEDDEAQTAQFEYVVQFCMRVLDNYIVEAAKELRAQIAAENGVVINKGIMKVELNGSAPYLILNHIASKGPSDIDIVYWQDPKTGEWKAQVVPVEPGSFQRRGRGFKSVDPLPEGIKFVHKGEFFMVAETEQALLDYIRKYAE